MRRLASTALVVLLLGACAASDQVTGERRIVGGVTMTFSVRPASVEVGQQVRLAVRLLNNTGRPEVLSFPTGQQYDFWITAGDEEIWRWSDDQVFTQAVSTIEIGPQDTVTLGEPWVPSESGRYVAHGTVLADEYRHDLTGSVTVGP